MPSSAQTGAPKEKSDPTKGIGVSKNPAKVKMSASTPSAMDAIPMERQGPSLASWRQAALWRIPPDPRHV
ncbi:MAG: hypothetical protein SangKO_023670 [Sandaracinaceae bacterium]